MSLIKGHWIVLAAAAASAVAIPSRLLNREPEQVYTPFRAKPTEIASQSFGGLSYALAAPPFDPDRTPGSAPIVEAPPTAAEETASPPPPPPPPVLVGIVMGGGKRAVALAKGANGQTETLAAGGMIGGWRLVAIDRDHAVFQLGGARHKAQLDFSNRTASKAPQPPDLATGTAQPSPASPPETSLAAQQKHGNSS